jgi:glycosyltransferase involved in cell wall biosynthesis
MNHAETTKRRRVLLVVYYWPPAGGSGVQRFLKFVKYFRDYGWEPVVFCPEGAEYPVMDEKLLADVPNGIEVIRYPIWEPFMLYKMFTGKGKKGKISMNLTTHDKKPGIREKLSLWVRANMFLPDAKVFWVKPAVKFLENYLAANPVEAVITTSPPMSLSLIGLGLQQKLKLPWIADFRDPWTDIDWFADLPLTSWAKKTHFRLQAEVLAKANAVTVIGPTMAKLMQGHVNRPIDVITNGYDEADLQSGAVLSSKFTLLHIGVLLRNRNHPFFWEILGELVRENSDFATDLDLQLIGQVDYHVPEEIDRNGLKANTTFGAYVPHDEAVRMQQKAQILLLFIDNIPTAKLTLTGKFFEYLMIGRPILAIGPPDGDVGYIVNQCDAGEVIDFGDKVALKLAIQRLYHDYKAGQLGSNVHGIEAYSRKALTGKMASVLNRITLPISGPC